MSEECNHDWVPYKLLYYGGEGDVIKVKEVKCVKCDETKNII